VGAGFSPRVPAKAGTHMYFVSAIFGTAFGAFTAALPPVSKFGQCSGEEYGSFLI